MKLLQILSIVGMMLMASIAQADENTPEEGDAIAAKGNASTDELLDSQSKQIIKTLQQKTFLKMRRWELSPHMAFVANDPFLKSVYSWCGCRVQLDRGIRGRSDV